MAEILLLLLYLAANTGIVAMIRRWDRPEKEQTPFLPHQTHNPYL